MLAKYLGAICLPLSRGRAGSIMVHPAPHVMPLIKKTESVCLLFTVFCEQSQQQIHARS